MLATARSHSEMSSIFIYQQDITFQNSSFFFILFSSFLEVISDYHFTHSSGETLYYISSIHSSGKILYYISSIHILYTYPLYIPRGKYLLHMLATARLHSEMNSIFTIQVVYHSLEFIFLFSFYFHHSQRLYQIIIFIHSIIHMG